VAEFEAVILQQSIYKYLLHCPPHLKRIATLPCEIKLLIL